MWTQTWALGTMDRSQCQNNFRTWSIHCPRYPGILAPSCDWTKNNKDNDARNNDERLEQRNWEPRGGSGAGLWYNARWIRALAPISRPGHFRFDGLHSLDTHLHTFILSIRRRIKDKHHEIIFHISDHRWLAGINSPNYRAKDHQFSIMQYAVTDVDLVFYRGIKNINAIKTALRGKYHLPLHLTQVMSDV